MSPTLLVRTLTNPTTTEAEKTFIFNKLHYISLNDYALLRLHSNTH